jgi:hypothetical protein
MVQAWQSKSFWNRSIPTVDETGREGGSPPSGVLMEQTSTPIDRDQDPKFGSPNQAKNRRWLDEGG